MSLSNPNKPVTEERLQEFYHKLVPYMGGGSGGGGGHTIEDSEGTDLTQRDTLQFGEGFLAEDDDTNEKTVITPDVMQSGDMDDVITPLPSVQTRYQKYSTEEQVIGEWIDGRPLYQKSFVGTFYGTTSDYVNIFDIRDLSVDLVFIKGAIAVNSSGDKYFMPDSKTDLGYYNGYIREVTEHNWSVNMPLYLTIQYTKTTDTPNT